jgi:four helix bundle protein
VVQTVQNYRDLLVWQKAMQLAVDVYRVTRDFPDGERFGLTTQLQRAVVSVASNIAEGQGRKTTPDFLRCLGIAKGSLQEVQTQLELCCRLAYLDTQRHKQLDAATEEVFRLLNGLVRSLSTVHCPLPTDS